VQAIGAVGRGVGRFPLANTGFGFHLAARRGSSWCPTSTKSTAPTAPPRTSPPRSARPGSRPRSRARGAAPGGSQFALRRPPHSPRRIWLAYEGGAIVSPVACAGSIRLVIRAAARARRGTTFHLLVGQRLDVSMASPTPAVPRRGQERFSHADGMHTVLSPRDRAGKIP